MSEATWPATGADLEAEQLRLAGAPGPDAGGLGSSVVGGVWVCFSAGLSGRGRAGDRAWAAAVVVRRAESAHPSGRGAVPPVEVAVVEGTAGGPYEPGLLALREGPVLESAVDALRHPPPVLLVNATGRDHPRRCGLALHLGAVLGVATVGVTHRPLLARGPWPRGGRTGSASPLVIEGETVGAWVRTAANVRPVAVHAAWRTDVAAAVAVVVGVSSGRRTPEPLRLARQAARRARAASDSS